MPGREPPTRERDDHPRRLLVLASAVVLVDTIFFAALTPLLPHYADEFGLSKTAAGVLTAAYAAGGLACALPAGWFTSRAGVRAAVLLGLSLMIGTSVAFGFATSSWALVAARFGQGVGSSLSWNGSLAWLVAATPRARRGRGIGTAMGASVGGALPRPLPVGDARGKARGAAAAPSNPRRARRPARRRRPLADHAGRAPLRRDRRARAAPPSCGRLRRARHRRHLDRLDGARDGREPAPRPLGGPARAPGPGARRARARGRLLARRPVDRFPLAAAVDR